MSKKLNLKDVLNSFKSVHGDKYDYSKVEYKNSDTKVCIICPEHGEFWQTPYKHLHRSQGCPKCGGHLRSNTSEWIEKARQIHGGKYDYSKVEYVDNKKKVCIICPEHGEFFMAPSNHLNGEQCPKCSKKYMDTEYFKELAVKQHGDKYDYSKVEYKNSDTKVCIICPEHGEFWQKAYSHINGCGCPKCGGSKRYNTSEWIENAKRVHGDKYDYSKVVYKNSDTKVCIICPEHGEFWQTPHDHLEGCGCPECSLMARTKNRVLLLDEFVKRGNEVHGNKYKYDKVAYKNLKDKVIITCKEHGDFEQEAFSHLSGCGCPKCSNSVSKYEDEIFEMVKCMVGKNNVESRNRTVIAPKEIDIYIPSKKIGIEYNGLLWHSDIFKHNKNYHYNKLISCVNNGVKLIQIFEDEYINHKQIVIAKLEHILGVSKKPKIYGRKCVVKHINYKEASEFLDKNHIQGKCCSTVYIGAFYGNQLVSVMCLKHERNDKDSWVLDRFASDINLICIGLCGKLFNYFVKKYKPKDVKSFADRRWTVNDDDNMYTKIGFKKVGYVKPDYHYYLPNAGNVRIHKFNMRKANLVKKYGANPNLTESVITRELGFYKIWDCGLVKYVWKE